ncbi:Interferon-gamma receptor beta chain [Pteropus alecto]|uniref:Interferon-gamma receptor beta chain n=1 Tax=Pteropus alecto TaxID=9402 RepID=L5K184_PTEAL|nr:Interferon-gamma receptor beta chain [Pteropus alecto]
MLSLSIGLWPSFHEAWYELGKVSVSWFNKDLEQRLAKLGDVETMDILWKGSPKPLFLPMDCVDGTTFSQSGNSRSQLPAPENLKIHLYNAMQVLSWEPVSLSNDTRPVVYQVQFKFSGSDKWSNVHAPYTEVNCTRITATECSFTQTSLSKGFPLHFNVSLRVRAELAERVSAWVTAPWFQHYRNVTVGPPENIWVTPGKRSLIVMFSPPFDVDDPSMATFSYYVRYWEKGGIEQARAFFRCRCLDFLVLEFPTQQKKVNFKMDKENRLSQYQHLRSLRPNLVSSHVFTTCFSPHRAESSLSPGPPERPLGLMSSRVQTLPLTLSGVKGPFKSNSIVLDDLKPLRVYCLQVKAELFWNSFNIRRPGHFSDVTCRETTIDASTKLQQDVLIAIGTFLVLAMLAVPCLFLVLKYRGLIKYWFESPPSIPLQIEEYLKDPAQPILEALDKDSSPKDDTWDSVSVISFPEKE